MSDTFSPSVRSRLAPTPSGFLHAGNGLNFILTWAITRAAGGRLLLRIDDLDRARYREKYVEDILRTIEWLGIDYDEGPGGLADFKRNWSQVRRRDLYAEALQTLRANDLLFACTCSRRMIRNASENGRYPGTCRSLDRSFDPPKTAWRVKLLSDTPPLRLRQVFGPDRWVEVDTLEAFVVRQKNGYVAYQLSSLVDDLHFGINTIVRGEDLARSTHYQRYLAHLLDYTPFSATRFYHHGMLLDDQGEKLSKSKRATSLASRRSAGRGPEDLFRQAARMLGYAHACQDGATLVQLLQTDPKS